MSNTNNNLQTQRSSVLHNDTVSSCSTSKVQEKTQLSRNNSSSTTDSAILETKEVDADTRRYSNTVQALNVDSLKIDLVIIQNACSEKEDNNSETASSKSVKESSLDSATKDVHAIKYKMSKAKERCMAYFRSLHSHLQVLSKENLKGTRIEHGFKQEFMLLFGQDDDTFTSTIQFQKFIELKFTLDYDSQMPDKYSAEYTRIKVKQFRETLLQHMSNVKKSVAERTRHQRQYDRRVNKRQMQMQKSKVDTGKALDANLVVIESSGTESEVQDENNMSGNATDTDDEDMRPIYDEEPMVEVGLTTAVPIADHSKNSSSFSDSKHIVCSTCHKCIFNANHDACIRVFLKEVNSHATIQSNKTRNSNKPVEQKSHTQKPNRQIFKGHRFSPNKTSVVYKKISPRSDLRWKPTGRIFKVVGLRWVPTGKIPAFCTSKDDSEPTHGSNVDIPTIHECKQTLDLSAVAEKADISETSVEVDSKLINNMTFEHNGSSLAPQFQHKFLWQI
ncbi:hypothetical protein Tco_1231437 [Tanacetum coccineum]